MVFRYYIMENDFPLRVGTDEDGVRAAEALRPDGTWVPFRDSRGVESSGRAVDEPVALTWWQRPQDADRTTRRGSSARCGNCGVRKDTYLTVHSSAAPIPDGTCGYCAPQGLARVVCLRRA